MRVLCAMRDLSKNDCLISEGEKVAMCEPLCYLYKCDIIGPDTLGRV